VKIIFLITRKLHEIILEAIKNRFN